MLCHDSRGFYGEAIDVAISLLDSPPVEKELKQTTSPLVLVVSEEIYSAITSTGIPRADSSGKNVCRLSRGTQLGPGRGNSPRTRYSRLLAIRSQFT